MTDDDRWLSSRLASAAANMPANPARLAQVRQRVHRVRRRRHVVTGAIAGAILIAIVGVAVNAVGGRQQRLQVVSPPAVAGRVPSPASNGDPIDEFVSQLRSHGLVAEIGGEVDQPFLHVNRGQSVHVQSARVQPADLQVYPYPTVASAAADARRFRPDGSIEEVLPGGLIRRVIPEWIAPPHVYQQGQLLVIYVGADSTLLATLAGILGSPTVG